MATYFDAINDGETTLANTLLASETVQIIVTDGSKLPVGGAGTSGFILKLEDNLGNVEYILCSSRRGNTVYIATSGRGYEGSIARQWLSGSYIKNVFTKATKDEISDNIGDLTYTEENYVVSDESASQSINSLDIQLNEVDSELTSHKADFMPHGINNAGFHNSIFRGKYLGSSVTTEQYNAISSGTFEDLYIGDYWTIGGINWRITAFNYYYNTGDSAFTTNHIVLTPDTILYKHVMNDTNITTGAYIGSKMYISGLDSAKTTIQGIFGAHLKSHRNYLHNATKSGYTSGGSWYDSEIELMTEANVYGVKHYGNAVQGTNFANNVYIDKSQYPLFALNPESINTRQSYWLRDVASSARFASMGGSGYSGGSPASYSLGVRPDFKPTIKKAFDRFVEKKGEDILPHGKH